jgi:hypothetical protein
MHNAFIVPPMREGKCAKTKEVRRRQAIVLQDNAFRFMLKEPIDGLTHSLAAAQVLLSKQGFHFTWPIHLCDHPAHFFAALGFAGHVESCSIGRDVKPLGTCALQGAQYLSSWTWPVENQE